MNYFSIQSNLDKMTAMSLMMMTSKITLPTTAIATRYSTRYSNFLLLLDSNSTRSQKPLLAGACCWHTSSRLTTNNGQTINISNIESLDKQEEDKLAINSSCVAASNFSIGQFRFLKACFDTKSPFNWS